MDRPRTFVPFLLVASLWGVLFPAAGITAPPPARHSPDELIIKYRPNAHAADRAAARGRVAARVLRDLAIIRAEHVKLDGVSVTEAIERLRNHPMVEYAEPNWELNALVVPNDPQFPQMYALRNTGQTGGTSGADIRATQAWDLFTGDPNVKIGVIDTGVDYNHPDLAANIWTNPGEIAGNGIDDDGNGYVDDIHGYDFINNDPDPFDDHGHGTHVSGTIAAVGNNGVGVVGVNWRAQIVGIKFLSAGGSGSTAGAIAAVQYSIAAGVRLTSNSWGGGDFSQALLDAINAAGAAGQVFVAAAGNSALNIDISPMYPAAYSSPYIVAVAATDHNDQLAGFSNWGPTRVHLAAPGVSILSTLPGASYGQLSGTSMATPHVSGAIGFVLGRFPGITALQARNLVLMGVDPRPALSGLVVTGGRLNLFTPVMEPDSIAPAPIADLETYEPSSNAIRLRWTATGDDSSTGRAVRYDIRYSAAPITPENFAGATPVPGPDPQPAGSAETVEVGGLGFNTTYHFALKAFDEFSNGSPISNVATGTTLGIPDITATPASFSEELLTGATMTRTLTLRNDGQGTLDWSVPTPQLLLAQPVLNDYLPLDKGVPDPRVGAPVTQGSGGPDAFGYRWSDSDQPGGPTFDWVDILGVGTPVPISGDDVTSPPIPMGMDFPYYGSTFNQVRVSSNGFISFTDPSASYTNQPLPNAGAPANMIAPMWDDLYLNGYPLVFTHFDGSRFIISWVGVNHLSGGGPYTFQVILRPSGEIRLQYLSMAPPTTDATVGIQNGTRDIGLNVAFNTNYLRSGLAVRISKMPEWITVEPHAGRILAGQSADLEVRLNAAEMLGGNYSSRIDVHSNDPDEAIAGIPVALRVIGAPDIAVSHSVLSYGTRFIGVATRDTVRVSNPGTDSLRVFGVTIDDADYTVDGTSFTVGPGSWRDLAVTFLPSRSGAIDATLRIASNDPDEATVDVALHGAGLEPPIISATPDSLSASLYTGETATRTVTVTNSGGSPLEVTVSGAGRVLVGPVASLLTAGQANLAADPTLNVTAPSSGPVVTAGDYRGTHLHFGITDHGEIMPYQYPDGNEHLAIGAYMSGYTVAYRAGGGDYVAYAGYAARFGIVPVSYREITNTPERLVAEAITRTDDGRLQITRTFTFVKDDRGVRVETELRPLGGIGLNDVVLKEWADWDMDGSVTNVWDYDRNRNMMWAQGVRYGAIAGAETPAFMDINGWNDYSVRSTYVDVPSGPLTIDGLGVLHFEVGDLGPGQRRSIVSAFATADDLAELRAVVERTATSSDWLTVEPPSFVVPAGSSRDITVTFDPGDLLGGDYDAYVQLASNDPFRSMLRIPAHLHVTGVPDIAVEGNLIELESVQNYATGGARTDHELPVAVTPPGGGTLTLLAEGDYGDVSELAMLSAEGLVTGQVGGVLTDCAPASGVFTVDAPTMAALVADGVVRAQVQNTAAVDFFCALNRHTLRLSYRQPGDSLLFGRLFLGETRDLGLSVTNRGTDQLVLTSAQVSGAAFTRVSPAMPHALAPGEGVTIVVRFAPTAVCEPCAGALTITSNDPDQGTVTVQLEGTGLEPPDIAVTPAALASYLTIPASETRNLTIANPGASDLTFTLTPAATAPGPSAATPRPPGWVMQAGDDPRSDHAPAGFSPPATAPVTASGATAVLVQDQTPWGTISNQMVLAANGIVYDLIPSSALATTDLGRYRLVIVASDQPSTTYATLAGRAAQLETFVTRGGVLEFHGAGWGWWSGDPSLVPLPGGVRVQFAISGVNDVLLPEHPLMRGVPDPFTGSAASHASVTGLPAGAVRVVANDLGATTLAEYRLGAGVVLVAGQTLEYGYAAGQAAGVILANLIPYAHEQAQLWLSASPASGTVPPGGSMDIAVLFRSEGLLGGVYRDSVRISSNDPDERLVNVPAELHATGVPDIAVEGILIELESVQGYASDGARTDHELAVPVTPPAGGTFTLIADGDYGDAPEFAVLTAEGRTVGQVGAVGTDCTRASGEFAVDAATLASLVADGVVRAQVQNDPNVNFFCAENRHTVRLSYRQPGDSLRFGRLFLGQTRDLSLAVSNRGSDDLILTSAGVAGSAFVLLGPTFPRTVAPGEQAAVAVRFAPTAVCEPCVGTLTITSNDPDQGTVTAVLAGTGVVPPDIAVAPAAIVSNLTIPASETRTLTIANTGASDLYFTLTPAAAPPGPATVPPAANVQFSTGDPVGHGAPVGERDTRPLTPIVVRERASAGPVLVIADNGTQADVGAVLAAAGYGVTEVVDDAVWNGTNPSPAGFELVVLLDGVDYGDDMPAGGQLALMDYVNHGGGLLLTEWMAFEVESGHYTSMRPLIPLTRTGGTSGTYTYRVAASHPVTAGVSTSFNVTSALSTGYAGSGTAVVTRDADGSAGVVVKELGQGRIVHFAFAGNYEGRRPFMVPDVQRLLVNAADWATRHMWLSVSPAAGTVPAGGTLEATVLIDSEGMVAGVHRDSIRISSNDPDEPGVVVPVTLNASVLPDIDPVPAAMDFGTLFVGQSRTLTLQLRNTGLAELEIASASLSGAAFSMTGATFPLRIPPTSSHSLSMAFTPAGACVPCAGGLTLVSNDTDESPLTIPLSGTALLPPDIELTPTAITNTTVIPGVGTQVLSVGNTGVAPLAFSIVTLAAADSVQVVPTWLTVTPTEGTVTAGTTVDVQLGFTTAGLIGGTYTATIRLTSNDPDEATRDVPVTLVAVGIPDIAATPTEVTFGDVFTGFQRDLPLILSNPGTDTLRVTSGAAGIPEFTLVGVTYPVRVAPLGTRTLTVRFAPTAPCEPCSTGLVFRSNDPDEDPFTVSVLGTGVVPPDVGHQPAVVRAAAATTLGPEPMVRTKTLRVENTGGSPLEFSTMAISAADSVHVYEGPELGPDDPDPRPGILGTGGPDLFGYRWVDSDSPEGPTFEWVDIVGVGTLLPLAGNDFTYANVNIGFTFPFYPQRFNRVNVCTNGFVSFSSTSTDPTNDPLPSTLAPRALLAAFWDDLDPGTYPPRTWVHNDGTRFIITWDGVRRRVVGGPYTFQIILYPTGRIVYQYLTMGPVTSAATIGIQNDGRTDGLTVVFNAPYVHNGLAIEFYNLPRWLSVTPTSGTVPAGGSMDLEVEFDAEGLADGDYTGKVALQTNDPDESVLNVPCNLHVGVVGAELIMNQDALNRLAHGKWVTADVELPTGLDPHAIDLATLRLQRTLPLAEGAPTSFEDGDMDGVLELRGKYDRILLNALIPDGPAVPVEAIGEVADVTWFQALDVVRMMRPGVHESPGVDHAYLAGSDVLLEWSAPTDSATVRYDLWYSADDGESWTVVATGIMGQSYTWRVPTQTTQSGRLELVALDALGLRGSWLSGKVWVVMSLTGVERGLPTQLALGRLGENPSRGGTQLEMALPERSAVDLRVYDVRGALVRRLADGTLGPGWHPVAWDGRDEAGRRAGAGIYFARMTVGARRFTVRIALLP